MLNQIQQKPEEIPEGKIKKVVIVRISRKKQDAVEYWRKSKVLSGKLYKRTQGLWLLPVEVLD